MTTVKRDCRRTRSGGGALQDVHATGRAKPDDVGQADLGVGDLTRSGLAPQVVAISHTLAMPVAEIGWPLDCRPPETLTGSRPSRNGAPGLEEVDGVALRAHSIRLS